MNRQSQSVAVGGDHYDILGVEDPSTGAVAVGIKGSGPMPQTVVLAADADEAADLREHGLNPLDLLLDVAAEDCRRAHAAASRPEGAIFLRR